MKSILVLTILVTSAIGCAPKDEGTTYTPPASTTDQTNRAADNVQASNMTPEQKAAAEAYLRQGASGAQQMQKQSQGSTSN